MVEIKVGQKWKSTDWWSHIADEQTVEITAIEGDVVHYVPGMYSVAGGHDDAGADTWEERWELVEDVVENKFNVGDKVRTLCDYANLWKEGEEGVIQHVGASGTEHQVYFPGQNDWWWVASYKLELVEENEIEETRSVSSTGAEKGVKLSRFSLLPMEALTEVAKHYGVGATKYEDHNMRRGYEWSKSFDALMRHATQFWSGEDHDSETGSKHLSAVVFHALTLMEFMETHPEFDDRYKLES